MKVINSEQNLEETIKQSEAVLVYFFNDSCAPCIALRPKVIELMKSHFIQMELLFVNLSEFPSLTSKLGVYESPVIIGFFEGKESLRFSKYISITELKSRISRYYSLLF